MHVCVCMSAFIRQFLSCAQLFRRAVPLGLRTNRIQLFLQAIDTALLSSSLAQWKDGQQPWHMSSSLAGQHSSQSQGILFAGRAAESQILLSGHYGLGMAIADGGNM